jgi:hypothetical protein
LAKKLRDAELKTHTHTHSGETNTTRCRICIKRQESCRGRVTQHSESETGMLSSSESLGKKICKLLRSFNIKHLDLLHLNALTDEEITHCNVLRLLVIRRVLSKAQRALVVTEKSGFVNVETDRIKQTLNKNHFTTGIRQRHELSILRGASDQMNDPRPPGDSSAIEHKDHAGRRLPVIQLASPVCIRKSTHHIWKLTGETNAGVENATKDRRKTMVIQKAKLLGSGEVTDTLLSHSNMLNTETVEPTRQLLDRERDVRASGDADKQ